MRDGRSEEHVVLYRSGSPLRDPKLLFSTIAHDLRASRELGWRLFVRNINARYRQTLLGYFWAIFPPLATTGIWLFLTRENIVSLDSGKIPYPVFLVTGTILWQTFVDAIQVPMRVISESKSMLAKINFPRESLLLTAFGECLFNFFVRLLVLIAAYVFMGFMPAITAPLALVGVLAIVALGMAIGLLLSPFSLLYDDVSNGVALVAQVWMYATPVIYEASTNGVMGWVNTLNPISPLLTQTRDWLLTGNNAYLVPSAAVLSISLACIVVGFVVYRIALPRAIERLSS